VKGKRSERRERVKRKGGRKRRRKVGRPKRRSHPRAEWAQEWAQEWVRVIARRLEARDDAARRIYHGGAHDRDAFLVWRWAHVEVPLDVRELISVVNELCVV